MGWKALKNHQSLESSLGWSIRVRMIEVLVRFSELDEAYELCKYGLSFKKCNNNGFRLLYNICHYHAAVIKHKQNNYKLSLKHFSDFFESMNNFCKGFLEKSAYDKLISENAFEIIKDESRIRKYLQNSLKIFATIHGENHSFVKNYVTENCKDYSWIEQKLIIIGHYMKYYLGL